MEKSRVIKPKCILISNSSSIDNTETLLESLKEGELSQINLIENDDKAKKSSKYDSCIFYPGSELMLDGTVSHLTHLLNENASILILIETSPSFFRDGNKKAVQSFCQEMSKTKFVFNILMVDKIDDLKELNLIPLMKMISDQGTGLQSLIFKVVSKSPEAKKGEPSLEEISWLNYQVNSSMSEMITNMHQLEIWSSEIQENDFIPVVARGYSSKKFPYSYGPLNSILYALGIGISCIESRNLLFLNECHPNFSVHPGFAVIPSLECLMFVIQGKVPNIGMDISMVLHAEQYTEIVSSIPCSGILTSQFKIVDILDKGKTGAIILVEVETSCKETRTKLFRNQFSIMVLGKGGFGGPRGSSYVLSIRPVPTGVDPEFEVELATSKDQAALYRLNGDLNPLHIDPAAASKLGFKQPILHGLCTQGIALTAVMNSYGDGKSESISSVKTRFTKPVTPGDIIR